MVCCWNLLSIPSNYCLFFSSLCNWIFYVILISFGYLMSMMYQYGFDYEIDIKLLITLLGCSFELEGLCYELVPSLIGNSRFLFMIAHFFICYHRKHLGTWHIGFIGGSTIVVFIVFRQDFLTLQKISNMNF